VKKAILALADGTILKGQALGFEGEACGEVVFHTAMTGYQEILTDPSYKGQMILMTCPHIGNYGIVTEDAESTRVWTEGFIVKESSPIPSNWRSKQSLQAYLADHRIVGIEGIDTRFLTRHIRDQGSQPGVISHLHFDPDSLVEQAREAIPIRGRDLVNEVTCRDPYQWKDGTGVWPQERAIPPGHNSEKKPFRIVVFDFGVKQNILRRLVDVGCSVYVVPASTSSEVIRQMHPDGIFLSNGPGDPEGVPYAVETVRQLIGWRPMIGICLGHQILGLALGMKAHKLKFGHHGANHPVLDLRTGKVEITSQNHNFSVVLPGSHDHDSPVPQMFETPWGRVQLTHKSLNDHCCEGMVGMDMPILSVQYHPEASPGPHDSSHVFRQFINMMEACPSV